MYKFPLYQPAEIGGEKMSCIFFNAIKDSGSFLVHTSLSKSFSILFNFYIVIIFIY